MVTVNNNKIKSDDMLAGGENNRNSILNKLFLKTTLASSAIIILKIFQEPLHYFQQFSPVLLTTCSISLV